MNSSEIPVAFSCGGASLYGILSRPEVPAARGVLILVGGPQYRVGSHRQFVLLARSLAEHGVPVLRFDYRGMGDSEGQSRIFEDTGEDLCAAIDHFMQAVPGLREVVIWGLCDGASAALLHAGGDARVTGLVLLNPWVRTDQGVAKAYLRHYYLSRLFQRELWQKIFTGRFNFLAAVRDGTQLVAKALAGGSPKDIPASSEHGARHASLPQRMLRGLRQFHGKVLVITSGNDLTAQEFSDLVNASREWRRAMVSSQVTRRTLSGANHTFASREWRDQVAMWTKEWLRAW